MTDHLSDQNLNSFIAGSLSSTEFLSVDDHLSECSDCRNRLAALQGTARKMSYVNSQLQSESIEHLPYEKLEEYVDEKCDATDQEIIQSHLQFCPACTDQVQEFKTFRTGLSQRKESAWGKVQFLWRSPEVARTSRPRSSDYSRQFRIVAIAAVVAFFAFVIALLNRTPQHDLMARLEEADKQNLQAQQDLRSAKEQLAKLNQQIAEMKPDHTVPVVASIQDHSQTIAVDQKGNLTGADHFPENYQQIAKLTLQEQRVAVPKWIAELQGQNEKLMGTAEGVPFKLLSPAGTVLESNRPVFQWEAFPGSSEYRVKIFDTRFHLVSSGEALHGTSWTPTNDLPRGGIYIWNVTAMKDGKEFVSPVPPAPEARFKVLEEAKFQELQNFRKGSSHLLTGLACANAGLIPEAKAEFEELLRENPDSPLVKKLLESVVETQFSPMTTKPAQ